MLEEAEEQSKQQRAAQVDEENVIGKRRVRVWQSRREFSAMGRSAHNG